MKIKRTTSTIFIIVLNNFMVFEIFGEIYISIISKHIRRKILQFC